MAALIPSAMHIPVLLKETLLAISPRNGGLYLDGTLGLGGHARAILEEAPECQICGLDRDAEALDIAAEQLKRWQNRTHFFQLPYASFPEALTKLGWKTINGALLDLGVSSLQLDKAERGFSFRNDGPLDMRMDQRSGQKSAWHIVNQASFEELRNIIAILGEDPQAGRIARRIIERREKSSIDSTAQLAETIWSAYPVGWRRKARNHPATRAFQALRMAVNDELGQLERFLAEILAWLAPFGRLVIISFHSLEDRMVKHTFKKWASGCLCPPGVAPCICNHQPEVKVIYKKPVYPGQDEERNNPRAGSARLRAAEKIG